MYYSQVDLFRDRWFAWITPLGTVLFLVFHQIGIGPFSWLLAMELLPSRGLELGSTLGSGMWWAFHLVFSLTLERLYDAIGMSGVFWMSALVSGLIYGFVLEFVPDIRLVRLEEIEKFFRMTSGWGLKRRGSRQGGGRDVLYLGSQRGMRRIGK